jgi:hypothetical protein
MSWPLAQAATMTKSDYKAGKTRISADYKAAKAACAAFADNANDICIQQAKAKERVARAELQYSYTAKPGDWNKLQVTMAESSYAVAKEKCDDKAGNAKDVCVQEAKAVEAKALADARMGQQIGAARSEANDAKRDADLKVATERCDALAGDAKNSCLAEAQARYGKE